MWARLRSFAMMVFRRTQWERDLRDEFECHLEERADGLEKAGLTREEARRRARIEFRRMETAKEECREARGARWVDEMSRNLHCAARSIRNYRAFSLVVTLSLAIGIGANLAVFSVLHRLVLSRLSVQEPATLYQLAIVSTTRTNYGIPYPKYELIRENFDIFSTLFGWGTVRWPMILGDTPQVQPITAVTANYFEALGVQPAIGHLFNPQDELRAADNIAVLSHAFWRTAYGGAATVLGGTVNIDGTTFTIVGVTPPEFRGLQPANPPAVYLTIHGMARFSPNAMKGPGLNWFHPMVRLRRGVTIEAARALLRDQWSQLDEPNRARAMRNSRDILILEDGGRGFSEVGLEFSGALFVLMGLVAAVFLIACTNVATLLLVRGADRLREMSIRRALGASRPQLIRQWLTECVLLAVISGIAGLLLARWITDGLLLFVNADEREWLRFDADAASMLWTICLTLLAAVGCGLIPAIRATAGTEEAVLRTHWATPVRRGLVAGGILTAQLAVSLTLLVGGAMFARTLWNLNTQDPGYDRQRVVYADADFDTSSVPRERRAAVMESIVQRIRQSPAIASAAIGDAPMIAAEAGWNYVGGLKDYTLSPGEDNTAYANFVLPGYFDVIRMPLLAGRNFEERDRPPAGQRASVMIINESMARHYFTGRDPIGQYITVNNPGRPTEIIGVVRDAKNAGLRKAHRDAHYRPLGVDGFSTIVARGQDGVAPDAVTKIIRAAFGEHASGATLDVAPLENAVQRSIGRDRLVAQMSAAFAALGIILATIGLYAAIAHSVSSRTREIGIRIAIGAGASDVMWMVLKNGIMVTALGVAIGLPLAILGSRLIRDLLFEVSPADPVSLGAATVLLALTGFAAGLWPARRAAKLDPSQTLRFE